MSRWMMNRIGCYNYWYHTIEEIQLEKGKLLLGGSNGSGKTITMAAFIPLVLDGNTSPNRLDPFGSKQRKISDLILAIGLDHDSRTSAFFIEFKKQDEEKYCTIGMCVPAVKGKKNPDKYYFIFNNNLRVGENHDIKLYNVAKDNGINVLSYNELKNKYGNVGEIIEKQEDYQIKVNQYLYGFESHQLLKEYTDLIVKLRSPKLNKDAKPSETMSLLTESLPSIGAKELGPIAEATAQVDQHKNTLLKFTNEIKALNNINSPYSRYNRFILGEKARQWVLVNNKLNELNSTIKDDSEKIITLNTELNELRQKKEDLQDKITILSIEKDTINSSEATQNAQKAINLEDSIKSLKKEELSAKEKMEEASEKIRELEHDIKVLENDIYTYDKSVMQLMEILNDAADFSCFPFHSQLKLGPLNESLVQRAKEDANDYQKSLISINRSLSKLKIIDNKKEEKQDELMIAKEERAKLFNEKDKLNIVISNQIEEYIDSLYEWVSENQVVLIENDDFALIGSQLRSTPSRETIEEVNIFLLETWNRSKDELRVKRSTLEGLAKNKTEEYDNLLVSKQELLNSKDPEPAKTEAVIRNRRMLTELEIPFFPFYSLLEFDSSLTERQKGAIEEALIGLGILDALVIDPKYKDQALSLEDGLADKYLFADQLDMKLSLKSYLKVVSNASQPATVADNVLSIIKSYVNDEEMYIANLGEEGATYGYGQIIGKLSNTYKSRFIGVESRKAYRMQQIEELDESIELIKGEINDLECIIFETNENINKGECEFIERPSLQGIDQSIVSFMDISNDIDEIDNRISSFEDALSVLLNRYNSHYSECLELSKGITLKLNTDVYGEAIEALYTYKQECNALFYAIKARADKIAMVQKNKNQVEEREDSRQYHSDIESIKRREGKLKSEELTTMNKLIKSQGYEDLQRRLQEIKDELSLLNANQKKTQSKIEDYIDIISGIKSKLERNREEYEGVDTQNELCKKIYIAELDLRLVGEASIHSEGSIKSARKMQKLLNDFDKDITKSSLQNNLANSVKRADIHLGSYFFKQEMIFNDLQQEVSDNIALKELIHRVVLVARVNGTKKSFKELRAYLDDSLTKANTTLRDKEKILIQQFFFNDFGKLIINKYDECKDIVKKIDTVMKDLDSESKLKMRIEWHPSDVVEAGFSLSTKELLHLLRKPGALLSKHEQQKIEEHFKEKLRVAKAEHNARKSHEQISLLDCIMDVFDYRKWFNFTFKTETPMRPMSKLTNERFEQYSGGEKAKVSYLPLLAATHVKFLSAHRDAPKIIALDEAFAGVDDQNIDLLFKVIVDLDFDFIITSQILQGDYSSIPELKIRKMHHDGRKPFVTTTDYVWNGYEITEYKEATEVSVDERKLSS